MTEDNRTASKIRLVQLLEGARRAGISPIRSSEVHFVAYLAEALSPAWGAEGQTLVMLKTGSGPFFRELQRSLDELVVGGLVSVSEFDYLQSSSGWRIAARYVLDRTAAQPLIERLADFPEERQISDLMLEICLGLAEVPDIEALIRSDVLFSDSRTSEGRLIEFRPDTGNNVATNVANYFSDAMADGNSATPGEKINLYLELLKRRARDVA